MRKKLSELITRPHQQVRFAVRVNDDTDGLEQNGILGVGMLNLFGFWRFLSFIQNTIETLVQSASDTGVLRRGVVLKQAQELHGEPRRRHEVVRIVL